MAKKATYDNESIQSLKGADRVRKRRALFLVLMGLRGANILFSRSFRIRLMKPGKAGVIELLSPALQTVQ